MPLSTSTEGQVGGNGKKTKSENSSKIPENTKTLCSNVSNKNIKGAETQNRHNIAKAMTR